MNSLTHETSPYLLQHADNPVDWLPWSAEALVLARQQDKPILLSIGYSACHWCHVMAHESFEDPDTAQLMNRMFVNIKVDREERPDLDKIYQGAHSLLTQRPGGWPLTVFLDPADSMPIFAGTYFPREPRHGLPSFRQLLTHIHQVYSERKDDIARQSTSIREVFDSLAGSDNGEDVTLNGMPLDIARNQIEQQFDAQQGGYSPAPKFPHVAILEHALRHWYRSSERGDLDRRILHTALFTTQRMSEGGLFDHLGGGFFRYSTDDRWMIPHFEKMLYDNGPLLAINTQAWCISGDHIYKHAARETAQWVMREMQAPAGGYYSALDADSEGVEGRFYTWQLDEIEELVDGTGLELLGMRFGLDRPANFEGSWHLHGFESEDKVAEAFELRPSSCHRSLHRLRDTLFNRREQRTRPGLDDKILTSWNALMIQGMAQAGRHLQQPRYIESAVRAAAFLRQHHWRDGRLHATSRDGDARLNAYLDDHAYLLRALLELLQCRWDRGWMDWALELADTLLQRFEDRDHGGFFFTSHDHEQLIQRSKSFADEAIPSGNGIALLCLQRLGYLTGTAEYLEAAEHAMRSAWKLISDNALAHCSMLQALDELLLPPTSIVLRGRREQLDHWQQAAAGLFLPDTMILPVPEDADLTGLPFLEDKTAGETPCAWICEGSQCLPAMSSLEEFSDYLASRAGAL